MGDPADLAPEKPAPGVVFVDGVSFPTRFETNRPMKEHIECIKVLELRHDDILLLAYPKCGTHWLWEVAHMLLAGKADYHKSAKEFAMLEATEIEKTQELPSPRVLNTHVPIFMLPRELVVKKVKVIHVYRNIKDVVVSMYFHWKQTEMGKDSTFDTVLDKMHSDKKNYFVYLKEMDEFIKENPDIPVFNVSFEDTKEDSVGVVTRLAEFLGVQHTLELCREVADACSFQKLKQADQLKEYPEGLSSLGIQFYRKGEVGDWKNHLTVAQSERLDAAMTQLEGCNYRFRYTLY